jgi:hypothetical protein
MAIDDTLSLENFRGRARLKSRQTVSLFGVVIGVIICIVKHQALLFPLKIVSDMAGMSDGWLRGSDSSSQSRQRIRKASPFLHAALPLYIISTLGLTYIGLSKGEFFVRISSTNVL